MEFHHHLDSVGVGSPSCVNLIVLEFLAGHVLVSVNPCGRCVVVAPLPQIAKLPKKSQNNDFKICELI